MSTAVRRVLVVTDVVGSTHVVSELGAERAAEMWARHDAIARDLVVRFSGREIDRSDGFLLLFEEVGRAVAFAVAYHEALRGFGIAARAGIHAGDVILRSNPPEQVARGAKPLEVDGVAKSIASRVASIALGGQTLITEHVLVPNVMTEARGYWRLKGVEKPLELFEVGVRGRAPFVPPPDGDKVSRVVRVGDVWLPVQEIPRKIPAERDAFVGRNEDLAELGRALDTSRFVSVLGVGGTGKTRLAIRYAWTQLADWPGGVWFCDLTEARSPDGIVRSVAQALDVPLAEGDPVVQLGRAIASRARCLLVLDNFEQVVRSADVLDRWLDAAPAAHFLVTTREVLGVPGEHVLALAPFPLPEGASSAVRDNPGVTLLIERARAANRTWRLADSDLSCAAAVVRMLEGIPLAIELAAAQVRVLTLPQVAERLKDRFGLLVRRGGRADRQATLRATLDWSWDLLEDHEREALTQLTSFSGGFTLTSAEAVLDVGGAPVIDLITRLVDKSMLREVHAGRFSMWVTVQEYVERRSAHPAAAHVRHGTYFASFGNEAVRASLHGKDRVRVTQQIGEELDNLLTACSRAIARADSDVAARTCRIATALLLPRGLIRMSSDITSAVLGMKDLSVTQRAQVEVEHGHALRLSRHPDAARHLESAVALAHEVDDATTECEALRGLGLAYYHDNRRADARACIDRSLDLAVAHGDQSEQAAALWVRGVLQFATGAMDEALASYQRALVLHRSTGSTRNESQILNSLGIVLGELGRHAEAGPMYEQALALARVQGDRLGEGNYLAHLGNLRFEERRIDEARRVLEDALTVLQPMGRGNMIATTLCNLGLLHLEEEELDPASTRLESALTLSREIGARAPEAVALGGLAELSRRTGDLVRAASLAGDAERILRELSNPIELSKLLCTKARIARDEDRIEVATSALDEARSLADSFGATPSSEVRRWIARAEAGLVPLRVVAAE